MTYTRPIDITPLDSWADPNGIFVEGYKND